MATKTFTPAIAFPAFSTEAARHYPVRVDGDNLTVWDSVAGHFTATHTTPAWHRARIMAEAARR